MTAVVTGIALDLDGTLVDSAGDITTAVNALLAEHGLPGQEVGYVERFIGEGTRQLVGGVYAGMGVDVPDDRLDEDVETYLAHYRRSPVARSRVYPGVLETLGRLRAGGVRLGICTNKAQEIAELVVDRLGLGELADVVVGGDALPARKPDPLHLLTVLDRLSTSPAEGLMVGDSAIDVACAERAGVRCVVVGWAPPDVGGATATRISDFAELLGIAGAEDAHQA